MKVIEVLGPGCNNCRRLETAAREAVAMTGVAAEIHHVTDYADIAAKGVMNTPGLIIDGTDREHGTRALGRRHRGVAGRVAGDNAGSTTMRMRTHTARVRVDDRGHLVLPPDLARMRGVIPATSLCESDSWPSTSPRARSATAATWPTGTWRTASAARLLPAAAASGRRGSSSARRRLDELVEGLLSSVRQGLVARLDLEIDPGRPVPERRAHPGEHRARRELVGREQADPGLPRSGSSRTNAIHGSSGCWATTNSPLVQQPRSTRSAPASEAGSASPTERTAVVTPRDSRCAPISSARPRVVPVALR